MAASLVVVVEAQGFDQPGVVYGARDLCVEKKIYIKRWVVLLARVNCGRWTYFSDRWQPSVPYVGLHRCSVGRP